MMILLLILAAFVLPTILVAWAMNRESDDATDDVPAGTPAATRARIAVAGTIGAVALGSVAFRWITGYGLQQSAALFVGIPAVLAIAAVFSPTPRSATGVACKAVTIGLLVSLIFLGEGMLCVLMSAPLFYAVAVVVGLAVDYLRRKSRKPGGSLISCAALLVLVPMSLEGVTEGTSLARDVSVSETRLVRASTGAVAGALRAAPRFDRVLPPYLGAGFPRPTATRITREGGETRWVIRVRGGEMRLDGMEPRAGDLILALADERPGMMQWHAVSDDSHMTHFLSWQSSRVEWEAVDGETTRVTWTLRYRRGLDPAWYFGPWQQYAARLAAGYLIESVATP